jgi:integrase
MISMSLQKTCVPGVLRLPRALWCDREVRFGEILSLEWSQVDFFAGRFNLRAGDAANQAVRAIPIVPARQVRLKDQFVTLQRDCPYVRFRPARSGRSVKFESFRKSWYRACVNTGLGEMVRLAVTDGKPVTAPLRGPRLKCHRSVARWQSSALLSQENAVAAKCAMTHYSVNV